MISFAQVFPACVFGLALVASLANPARVTFATDEKPTPAPADAASAADEKSWQPLFNGKDLDGW